jgi:proline dehydrogenase
MMVKLRYGNMNIDFENTRIAFKIKSDRDLRRANILFTLISYPVLVKIANPVIRLFSVLRIPVGWLVKPTAFKHFVGGETLEECQPSVEKLKTANVHSILDYSVEGKESDRAIQAALDETLRNIRHAGSQPDIPFTVFKPTAFGNSRAMEILSGASVPDREVIEEGEKFRIRVETLCQTAFDHDVPIMIDAEDYLLSEFYRPGGPGYDAHLTTTGDAIVFNTYQMYRHDRIGVLQSDIAKAREGEILPWSQICPGCLHGTGKRKGPQAPLSEDPIQPDKESHGPGL